jgi:hypothetical protein
MALFVDDIVYLREAKEGDKCCQVKCAQRGPGIGLFPRDMVEEHLEPIEFPLHEAAKMGDWEFLAECLENKATFYPLNYLNHSNK